MNGNKHISELRLEKLILGELSEEEERELRADEETAARIRDLEQSNRSILSEFPPRLMAEEIARKASAAELAEKRRPAGTTVFPVSRVAVPVLAAAVLALTLGIVPRLYRDRILPETPVGTERIKGLKPSLNVYRERGDQIELLSGGEIARENDRLQIEYNAAGKRFGLIFSIDGRGTVSLHFPDFIDASNRLDDSGSVPLPFSYQLDDAPDFERFFFVLSDSDFDVESILEKARILAKDRQSSMRRDLDLPPSFEQVSLLVKKEASR